LQRHAKGWILSTSEIQAFVKEVIMYSKGRYHGQRFVRTQRSAQARRGLMVLGLAGIVGGGLMTTATLNAQDEVQRTINATTKLAHQVIGNRETIAAELANANSLASKVGNEVADPAVAASFNTLRMQGKALSDMEVVIPARLADTDSVNLSYEIAQGQVAAQEAVVRNLRAGAKSLSATHDDYVVLVEAKAGAQTAAAALTDPIARAQEVFDTTPALEDEGLRAKLDSSLKKAREMEAIAKDTELKLPVDDSQVSIFTTDKAATSTATKTPADYDYAAQQCDMARAELERNTEAVANAPRLYVEFENCTSWADGTTTCTTIQMLATEYNAMMEARAAAEAAAAEAAVAAAATPTN
jgi:hypothetical protein